MTKDDKDIVSALQQAMFDRVGKDRFELWFGSGVRFAVRGETLAVQAGDRFTLDRIRRNFRRELQSAAAEVSPSLTNVDFSVDREIAKLSQSHDPVAEPTVLALRGGGPNESDGRKPLPTAQPKRPGRRLRRLDQLVVGDANRVAYTAAQSMLARPGVASPFFVYGPPGCGKTHLLEALAHAARGGRGMRRVISISAEQFTSSFLGALNGGGLPSFRAKHRDVELLLIDDVQFFNGKPATLVELQYTLDTLLRENNQIVLAADRSPAELRALGPELITRLSGGLVCGVESADEAMRQGILRRFAAEADLCLPDEVIAIVAAQMAGDARQLAGAIHRLKAVQDATAVAITEQNVAESLQDLFRSSRRPVRLCDIQEAVCEVFGLDNASLVSGRKLKSISQPRMLAMWLARKYTRAALAEIGEHFGRRSHSTVISAQKKVDMWVAGNGTIQLGHSQCAVRDAVRRIEAHLRTG